MKEPRDFKNVTTDDPCEVCFDEGWVTLKGRVRIYGYDYSRGSAPCHWCELGTKTFEQARKRKIRVVSDYKISDVVDYNPDVEYLPKAEARRLIRDLLANPEKYLDLSDPETKKLWHDQGEARKRNYA